MLIPDFGQLRTNSRINQFSTGKFFRDEDIRQELPPHERSTGLPDEIARVWDDTGFFDTNPAPPVEPPYHPSGSRLLRSDRTMEGLEAGELTSPLIGMGIGFAVAAISFPHREKNTLGTIGLTVGGFLVGLNAVELIKKVVD